MAIPVPKKIFSHRSKEGEMLTATELHEFMQKNGISINELSEIFGVTTQAVKLWLNGERGFSVTNSRLVRLFIKNPKLIREF